MNNIVILDTETTGLDPSNGNLLEIAAILYNIPSRSIIAQCSTLLYAEQNPAEDINRISVAALKCVNEDIQVSSTSLLMSMITNCDAIVAHNAEFDKKWIATHPILHAITKDRKWICTRNDVIWPIRKGCALNLVHICVDLGVPIVNAHRALSDCSLLVAALDCIEDLEFFLDKSGKGRKKYLADVKYENRQLAKDHGFLWDNVRKEWYAKLTELQAQELPFNCWPCES